MFETQVGRYFSEVVREASAFDLGGYVVKIVDIDNGRKLVVGVRPQALQTPADVLVAATREFVADARVGRSIAEVRVLGEWTTTRPETTVIDDAGLVWKLVGADIFRTWTDESETVEVVEGDDEPNWLAKCVVYHVAGDLRNPL